MVSTKEIRRINHKLGAQSQRSPGEFAVTLSWKHWTELYAAGKALGLQSQCDDAIEGLCHLLVRAGELGMTRLPLPPRQILDDPWFNQPGVIEYLDMNGRDSAPNAAYPRVARTGISGGVTTFYAMTQTKAVMPMGFAAAEGIDNRVAQGWAKKQMRDLPSRVVTNMALGQKTGVNTNVAQGAQATVTAPKQASSDGASGPAKSGGPKGATLINGKKVDKAELLKQMKKDKAVQAAEAATGKAAGTDPAKSKSGSGSGSVSVKKEKRLTPCLDGCGTLVAGRFAPGHDAKCKSLLIKVERGELELGEVPEPLRLFVEVSEPVFTNEEMIVPDTANPGKSKKIQVQTANYQILRAPVRFPGRDDVEYWAELSGEWAGK